MRIKILPDVETLDRTAHNAVVVLYKHSPVCWFSAGAIRQVQRFADGHPETPVFMVDVVKQRGLSVQVAQRLGVTHESPQVIVLHEGTAVWHASHFGVRARALGKQVARLLAS